MSTFVLVHGAWHGAWCWERLIPELTDRGHGAIAVDLPVEDGSATFSAYAEVVLDAMESSDGSIVLVGHSLGAMVIPIVAARRPIDAMVYLCPVVPNLEGSPWDDAPPMETPGLFDDLVVRDGAAVIPTLEVATRAFYHDCPPDDAAWAFSRLRAQNSTSLWSSTYPLTQWPGARNVAIVATDDHTVTLEFASHVCRERLGLGVLEIPGGHSPFLSRPGRLATMLEMALA